VTNINLALMNALGLVFPSSLNLFCWFHIDKNVEVMHKKEGLKDR